MRRGFFIGVLALCLGPMAVSAQSFAALDDASSRCLFDVPGSENLHIVVRQKGDGTAGLLIRKKRGASDELVSAYRTCIQNRVSGGVVPRSVAPAAGTPVATSAPAQQPSGYAQPTTAPKRIFQRRNKHPNPLCPEHAGVIFGGSIYCVGNQS